MLCVKADLAASWTCPNINDGDDHAVASLRNGCNTHAGGSLDPSLVQATVPETGKRGDGRGWRGGVIGGNCTKHDTL
jgi:hypothetical protein